MRCPAVVPRRFACVGPLAAAALASVPPAAAQSVNQPPLACYVAAGTTCLGASDTDLVEAVSVRLNRNLGGGPIGLAVQDVDAGQGSMIASVWIEGGLNHAALTFSDPGGIVVPQVDGSYRMEAPIDQVDAVLRTMGLEVAGVPALLLRVRLELHDQGFSGACSVGVSTPCDKVATASVYVDAYSGTTPERIFLDAFAPR